MTMEKVTVERTIWIDASRERVWRAVTEPERLDRWYAADSRWQIPALEMGARVKFYNRDNEADHQIATIEVIDPPRQFRLRWEPDKTYPAMTLVTTFLLQEEDGGTRVTLSETGYEALHGDERQRWLDLTGSGYTISMENLKAYLEGRELPYQ